MYASLTLKWNCKLEANAIKSYCPSEEENEWLTGDCDGGQKKSGRMSETREHEMASDEPWVPKVLLLLAVLIYFLGAIEMACCGIMLLYSAKTSHSYWFNKNSD